MVFPEDILQFWPLTVINGIMIPVTKAVYH